MPLIQGGLSEADEARRLAQLFAGQGPALIVFLSNQLGVVKTQAQMLLGLCGLAVTVTGFSGAHMVRAGPLPALLMVVGIALVLGSALLCLRTLTATRWVSQDLADDLSLTALAVIARRNRQQDRLTRAGHLVAAGLAAYLSAVALAALLVTFP